MHSILLKTTNLSLLDIENASEKKINICGISSHTFKVGICLNICTLYKITTNF